jgi:hypothetical protein
MTVREKMHEFMRFLEEAAGHYDKTAPTVEQFVDNLYRRMGEKPETVTLFEIMTVEELRQDGVWEQPNYAANRIYHLMERLGRPTTGHAGF